MSDGFWTHRTKDRREINLCTWFSKEHSTPTVIFEYVQFLYENYYFSKVTSSTFVDYSKAFDTIYHNILLKKLKLYGLDNHCLNWFRNYLNNRTQVVKINRHIVSKPQSVRMGVLQGSILGPFLLILSFILMI